ncbi:MAG: beta-ketoacyl-[acyl-carrier-protein] synthase family protein [Verrucomicrobiota bacterium]
MRNLNTIMMGGNPCRVALTGLGVISPSGIGLPAFWDSLLEKKSGIGPITRFDTTGLKARIAGEVGDFVPEDFIPVELKPRRMARQTQFALAAAKMALEDADLKLDKFPEAHPVTISIGSSTNDIDTVSNAAVTIHKRGINKVSPSIITTATVQSTGAHLASMLGVPTDVKSVSTTCSSGTDAVGLGMDLIRSGKAEIVIAGGTDCPITPVPFGSMAKAGLCATNNDDPGSAARPFDRNRETGVVSEGCGIVILENLEFAKARGAQPYAELTGFSTRTDQGTKSGEGFSVTMREALGHAGRTKESVDSISAWAPGHPEMDVVETEAIKEVFGDWAYRLAVVSIKGLIGNPFGATGVLMLIASALSIKNGMLPPTANCEEPDPLCDLDYVTEGPRRVPLNCILMNSHGVGGGNSSLIIERCA